MLDTQGQKFLHFDSPEASFYRTFFDTVHTGLVLNLDHPISVSLWLKPRSTLAGAPYFLSTDYTNGVSVLSLNTRPDELIYAYNENEFISTAHLDTTWHNVIWYNSGGSIGNEFGLYLDGKKISKYKMKTNKHLSAPLFLNRMYHGLLEDFRLYNFVLTRKQTEKIFEMGKDCLGDALSVDGKTFKPQVHKRFSN